MFYLCKTESRSSTALDQPFPGQYHDQETGLNYNYFRSYNPATGRYTQSDPIGLEGGLNTYSYVANRPVSSTDMYGLVEWKGSYEVITVSAPIGITLARFDLKSDCIDGFETKVDVVAVMPAVSVPLKITGTRGGQIVFEDYKSKPNPSVFSGRASMISLSITFADYFDRGYSRIMLGDAYEQTGNRTTFDGLDIGIGFGMFGTSGYTGVDIIECGCGE